MQSGRFLRYKQSMADEKKGVKDTCARNKNE